MHSAEPPRGVTVSASMDGQTIHLPPPHWRGVVGDRLAPPFIAPFSLMSLILVVVLSMLFGDPFKFVIVWLALLALLALVSALRAVARVVEYAYRRQVRIEIQAHTLVLWEGPSHRAIPLADIDSVSVGQPVAMARWELPPQIVLRDGTRVPFAVGRSAAVQRWTVAQLQTAVRKHAGGSVSDVPGALRALQQEQASRGR